MCNRGYKEIKISMKRNHEIENFSYIEIKTHDDAK